MLATSIWWYIEITKKVNFREEKVLYCENKESSLGPLVLPGSLVFRSQTVCTYPINKFRWGKLRHFKNRGGRRYTNCEFFLKLTIISSQLLYWQLIIPLQIFLPYLRLQYFKRKYYDRIYIASLKNLQLAQLKRFQPRTNKILM